VGLLRSDRKSDLWVQPKELAQKLIRELEDRKVSREGGVLAPHRFTVYLCPQDFDRLESRLDNLVTRLERVVSKYVRRKRYESLSDIVVRIVREPDLRNGYFGILAEQGAAAVQQSKPVQQPAVAGMAASGGMSRAHAVAPSRSVAGSGGPSVVHHLPTDGAWDGHASSSRGTKIIPPSEAVRLNLAAHTIVLRSDGRAREFTQGRIVLGRARDVDYRIDNPNVSRRHAALFWSEGRVVVEDLDSTNGTMVNGYPVTSTVLRSNDVLAIGESRIVVDIRSG
jgi:hypothetical protein